MISECYNHHSPLKKKKKKLMGCGKIVYEVYFEFEDSEGEFQ